MIQHRCWPYYQYTKHKQGKCIPTKNFKPHHHPPPPPHTHTVTTEDPPPLRIQTEAKTKHCTLPIHRRWNVEDLQHHSNQGDSVYIVVPSYQNSNKLILHERTRARAHTHTRCTDGRRRVRNTPLFGGWGFLTSRKYNYGAGSKHDNSFWHQPRHVVLEKRQYSLTSSNYFHVLTRYKTNTKFLDDTFQ
jgi:hypothetical protein